MGACGIETLETFCIAVKVDRVGPINGLVAVNDRDHIVNFPGLTFLQLFLAEGADRDRASMGE